MLFFEEKNLEQQVMLTLANLSLLDSFSNVILVLGDMIRVRVRVGEGER